MILSIITVNYNNADGLRRTIDSVMRQSTKEYEWIVVDGGSTDGSVELIQSHSDYISLWVSEKDSGIYDAMNKGVGMAHGQYCLFLNSGDLLYGNSALEQAFDSVNGADYVFFTHNKIDDYGNVLNTLVLPEVLPSGFWMYKTVCHQAMFIRTSLLKLRPYDITLRLVADWEHVFHHCVLEGGTYQVVQNVVLTDVQRGGVSEVNVQQRECERESVLLQHFSWKEIDTAVLSWFSENKEAYDSNYLISERAYVAFSKKRYDMTTYIEVFTPYKSIIINNGTWKMRFVNCLNIHRMMCLSKCIV